MSKSLNIESMQYDFEKKKSERCLDYIKSVKSHSSFACGEYKISIEYSKTGELVKCVGRALK